MGKIAFLFAGQGAQAPGMGQELCQNSKAAAAVFAMADSRRPGTSAQCFEGTAEDLAVTQNTQPCVFTVDLAAAEALVEAGIRPDGVAGFSLGEVAALAFAGMLSHEEAFDLVCRRAELMHHAASSHKGGMAAVMRLDDEQVRAVCAQFDGAWPVNYNCDGQVAVAADEAQLDALCKAVAEVGGSAKKLAVSGAFHSPQMAEAAKGFLEALSAASLKEGSLPVYANLTARPYQPPYAQTLAAQIESPVLWKQTIRHMLEDGYTTFIEVGPGKTLTGFNRRLYKDGANYFVNDSQSLQATIDACLPPAKL